MDSIDRRQRLLKFQKAIHQAENFLLVLLLAGMICLSAAQILLRNVFDGGLIWGESMVRVLVLWVGLFGSMVASRQGKHINVDILTRFLPDRLKSASQGIVELFTSVVCFLLVYFSLSFVRMEHQFGQTSFSGIPSWILTTIIPFGFTVIALRYLIAAFLHFRDIQRSAR